MRIAALLDDGTALSFADQRTFGGWLLADLVTVDGSVVPVPVAHVARDPLDPLFDAEAVVKVLRRKHSADQAPAARPDTWCRGSATSTPTRRCGGPRSTARGTAEALTRRAAGRRCWTSAAEVMRRRAGARAARRSTRCTSTSTASRGSSTGRWTPTRARGEKPCERCGAVMRREKFMNRSSFYCPRCQPRPRS